MSYKMNGYVYNDNMTSCEKEKKELTPLEALCYLDDIAHGRKMKYDPHELKLLIESALKEKEHQDGVLKTLKEVIKFEKKLPHIEPNKDNHFDKIVSVVTINIQRDTENKERELLRKWVLQTCFPKELKALDLIKEYRLIIYDETWDAIVTKGYVYNLPQDVVDLLKEVLL